MGASSLPHMGPEYWAAVGLLHADAPWFPSSPAADSGDWPGEPGVGDAMLREMVSEGRD